MCRRPSDRSCGYQSRDAASVWRSPGKRAGVGGRFKKETYVELIHFIIKQKSTQQYNNVSYHICLSLRVKFKRTFQITVFPYKSKKCLFFFGCISFLSGSMVKNPPGNAGDLGDEGSNPGLERSPGEGNGNPLQYSCLENPMDRGAWQTTVQGVAKVRLSNYECTCTYL